MVLILCFLCMIFLRHFQELKAEYRPAVSVPPLVQGYLPPTSTLQSTCSVLTMGEMPPRGITCTFVPKGDTC